MLAQSVIPIPSNPSIYPSIQSKHNFSLWFHTSVRRRPSSPNLRMSTFGCLSTHPSRCPSIWLHVGLYLSTYVSLGVYVGVSTAKPCGICSQTRRSYPCEVTWLLSELYNHPTWLMLSIMLLLSACLPGYRRRRRGIRVNGNAENENFPCSWSWNFYATGPWTCFRCYGKFWKNKQCRTVLCNLTWG